MKIGIVDSGGANLASIQFALDRIGSQSFVSSRADQLIKADKLLLPGVGAAKKAMQTLNRHGLIEFLQTSQQPILGICLGMQLLFEDSEEGHVECLGLLPGKVKSIPTKPGFSIPHMGWNQLNIIKSDCITKIFLKTHMSTSYIAIMLGLAAIVLPVQITISTCLLSLELRSLGLPVSP